MSEDIHDLILSELRTLRAEVIDSLKEAREDRKQIWAQVSVNREALAGLKVKSGVWGALAGIIPVALGLAYMILKG